MAQHPYPRINIHTVTPETAPERGVITHSERNHPLALDWGSGRIFLGKKKVRYEFLGADADSIYLRCRDERRRPTATPS